jgi:hypothetical protein
MPTVRTGGAIGVIRVIGAIGAIVAIWAIRAIWARGVIRAIGVIVAIWAIGAIGVIVAIWAIRAKDGTTSGHPMCPYVDPMWTLCAPYVDPNPLHPPSSGPHFTLLHVETS